MNITVKKFSGRWQISIDGKVMNLTKAAKILNVSRETFSKAFHNDGLKGLHEAIERHHLWDRLEVPKGTKLYHRGNQYVWARMITDASGVCTSQAYRLMKAWSNREIDCDELFRPPLNQEQLKVLHAEKSFKKRGEWDLGKMNPRKDIKDIPQATKLDWEYRNQDTSQCLPGSGRGSGGSCRY